KTTDGREGDRPDAAVGDVGGDGGDDGGDDEGIVEVAVARPVAEALKLSPGSEFRVVGRLDGVAVRVRVTGIFLLTDPYAPRWAGDELLRRGVERGDYTTYGPLVVPEATFAGRFAHGVTASWWSVPDLGGMAPDRLRSVAASAAGLSARVKADCPACTAYTRLPEMLTRLDQAALVARSTMLVPVLQLVLLAAYALMLTARLLADHRRMEVALLRSRGAGAPRLALLAGAEALLVALPSAVAAPFLAPPLLGLVESIPWIRRDGPRLVPEIGASAFAVSILVAIGCAALLALPAVQGIRRTYVEEQGARGRGARRGLIQRAGVDAALLVLAALALWQLRRYGGPVTGTTGGGLGVDPLIVTGPALALLCGGMLGLRLVPGVSGLAARVATPRRGLAAALGSWQVSRRPLKYAGPALLLTMAVAIGVLSMATAATWRTSQQDQARHQAGADLRISGSADVPELGPLGRGSVFAALPGVTGVSPVVRSPASLNGDEVTLLAADSTRLGRLMLLRADLLQHPQPPRNADDQASADEARGAATAVASVLSAGRPEGAPLVLPGTPKTITVLVRLSLDSPDHADAYAGLAPRLVAEDALGVRHEIALGALTPDGRARRITVDLAALAGRSGRLAYPLAIRGLRLDVPAPATGSALTLTLAEIRTDAGEAASVPTGGSWTASVHGGGAIGSARAATDDGVLTLHVPAPAPPESSARRADESVAVMPAGDRPAGPLPVVITADVAARKRLSPGGTTSLLLDGRPVPVRVAGIVTAMPAVDPTSGPVAAGAASPSSATAQTGPAVLADLRSLLARDLADAVPPSTVTEWWLSLRDETGEAAAIVVRHPEWGQSAVDRAALQRRLLGDPLAAGLQGALILGFAAALLFAVLAFVVNAAVAARERAAEFAVLRALGASLRQTFALLAVEQAFLAVLAPIVGTLLALGVAALVVPHIVLTGQAAAVTPDVLLTIPWAATLALPVAVAAALSAIVAILARSVHRTTPPPSEER
ncbi:ABC transporter permease, partial [Thermopolyspora sp. NPDC052614]|uniref:ABC transporter permease n=1 Tax=Thermopolyspora sp. NPDC052614 TaxID=3155682 RepID=UPI003440E38E